MDRSAVILADEINTQKGIPELDGKPLISHVIDVIGGFVDEVIVVADSQSTADAYAKVVDPLVKVIVNTSEDKGSLASALAGFQAAQGEYTLILPSGSVFIAPEVISLLLDCAAGKAAVVPRWTDQRIEALHAVYHTKKALDAANAALAEGEFELDAAVSRLRGVRFISTLVIEQIDPEFKSFFTAHASIDSKKAQALKGPRPKKQGRKPQL